MKLKTWQRNVLLGAVIAAGGFLLFNLAFLFAALTMQVCRRIILLFSGSAEPEFNPMLWRYVFAILILLISWFVLRSKLPILVKATYLTMPLMVLLVMVGIQFYAQPQWVPIALGGIIVAAVLAYLYQKKLAWQYYFAALYTAALALYIVLAGIDI